MKRTLKSKLCVLLALAMVTESMSVGAWAGERTATPLASDTSCSSEDYEILPDMDNASMKLLDENGNELEMSDEVCREAMDTCSSILEEFSGRTIDMSDYDCTDAVIEAFGSMKEDVSASENDAPATDTEASGDEPDEPEIGVNSDDPYDKGAQKEERSLRGPVIDGDDVIWDCVWFGSFKEGDKEGDQGIKWRVLEADDESALLIADEPVASRPFNPGGGASNADYKNSSLKKFVENSFFNSAFSTMEQLALAPKSGEDKIFIPTWDKLNKPEYGFSVKGAKAATDSGYWLDPGNSSRREYVDRNGDKAAEIVSGYSFFVPNFVTSRGVRPMIRINTDKDDVYSYAGTYSLKNGVKEEAPDFISEVELDPGEDNTVNGKESDKITLVRRKPVKKLPEASKRQYDFLGWYADDNDGKKYTADSVIPDDVETLYAHYDSKYSNTYKFKENISLKMADSPKNGEIPFLSNGFNFDFAGISSSLVYDRVEGTYEVGIGFDIARVKDIKEEGGFKNFLKAEGKDLSETCESVMKALGDARDMGNVSKPIKVSEGSWEPSVTVMGYAEGTLGDDGLNAPEGGRLFIGFEIYTDNHWQTAICFIPIALRLKFGAEGSLTLGIEAPEGYNAKTLVGDVEIVLPGIELRAGVGLARVASVGVYGSAQNRIDIEMGRDGRSGKTAGWWYLKGEAGGYVQVLFFDYKKKFIEGTIKILEWGNHTTNPLGGYTALEDYETVEEFEVKRTNEDPINDWMAKSTEPSESEEVLGFEYNPDNGALGEGRVALLKDMHDMPEPSVAQSADAAVLVFMAEDNNRDVLTGNDVKAYYSVWDDEKAEWGTPAFIDEGSATADFYPVVTTDGNDIWAVWMDSKEEISPDDSEVLESISGDTLTDEQIEVLDRCAQNFEIKVARFDGTKFTDIVTLTHDNVMGSRPAAVADEGKVYVAWLTDDDVDFGGVSGTVSGDKGRESIMSAVYDGTDWGTPVTVESGSTYTDMNVGILENKPVVVYGKDMDRNLSRTGDEFLFARELPSGEEVKLSDREAHSPDFGMIKGKDALIWYENGDEDQSVEGAKKSGLRFTFDMTTVNSISCEDPSVLSPSFKVLDDYDENNEGGTIILCASMDPYYDAEEDKEKDSPHRGIYAYVLDEEEDGSVDAGWPVYINNTGIYGDAGSMTGFWKTNDAGEVTDLLLVYPETKTDFDAPGETTFGMNTTLFMTSFMDDTKVDIDEDEEELLVLPENIEKGRSVALEFNIKNNSLNDVENVWTTVIYGDKELQTIKIDLTEPLEAGDETSVSVNADLPQNLKKGDRIALRIGLNDPEELKDGAQPDAYDGDKEISFNVGNIDLFLTQKVEADANGVSVNYAVENSSIYDTEGTFRLYTRDEKGNKKILIEEKNISFPAKETMTAAFREEDLDELADLGDVIYAEVEDIDGRKYENELGDNEDFFKVTRAKADEVILSKKELVLSKGESQVLTAAVAPEALSSMGVYWCSTDENVATVDDYGKVIAKGVGTAEIIATANDGSGVKAYASVIVTYGDLAGEGDTDALIPYMNSKGKMAGYQLSLSENRTSAVITVAKGNKFVIANGTKGSFAYKNPADKKSVAVNKKGKVRAKKPIDGAVISYTDQRSGKTVEVTVRVREMKFAGSKNLKTTVSANAPFDLQPELLMNAEFKPKNEKYKSTVPDFKYEKDKYGKWHVTGKPVKSGSVGIPVYVYGKKFNMKIKVK